MIILSMDLSLNGAGLAVLEVEGDKVRPLATELIDNKKVKGTTKKLFNIASRIDTLFSTYKVDYVCREKGFHRFAGTTQKLFKVVGVSDLIAYKHGFHDDMDEVTPTTVKKAITGDGKADKELVMMGIRGYLVEDCKDMEFASDDVSDAIAVGITKLKELGFILRSC